jgi:hypothetical protein
VKLPATIGHLLALLATVGLMLAPIARSAAAMPAAGSMSMGAHSVMADESSTDAAEDMPCCPGEPSIPDCGKDCPFMALCVSAPLNVVPLASFTVPRAFVGVVFPDNHSDLTSLALAPPEKPPKI